MNSAEVQGASAFGSPEVSREFIGENKETDLVRPRHNSHHTHGLNAKDLGEKVEFHPVIVLDDLKKAIQNMPT